MDFIFYTHAYFDNFFHQLCHYTHPLAICECSSCSPSFFTDISYWIFNFIHSSECALVPYWGCNLQFPC